MCWVMRKDGMMLLELRCQLGAMDVLDDAKGRGVLSHHSTHPSLQAGTLTPPTSPVLSHHPTHPSRQAGTLTPLTSPVLSHHSTHPSLQAGTLTPPTSPVLSHHPTHPSLQAGALTPPTSPSFRITQHIHRSKLAP